MDAVRYKLVFTPRHGASNEAVTVGIYVSLAAAKRACEAWAEKVRESRKLKWVRAHGAWTADGFNCYDISLV